MQGNLPYVNFPCNPYTTLLSLTIIPQGSYPSVPSLHLHNPFEFITTISSTFMMTTLLEIWFNRSVQGQLMRHVTILKAPKTEEKCHQT